MRRENISEAVGNIGDSYIAEAAGFTAEKKRNVPIRTAVAAACLCILAAAVLFALLRPGRELSLAYPQDLAADPSDGAYMTMRYDLAYYRTARDLVAASSVVCAGVVTDISFALGPTVTEQQTGSGQAGGRPMLFTVYTVSVTCRYKGLPQEIFSIRVPGGIAGYRVSEQYDLLASLGPLEEDPEIPVCQEVATLAIGNTYLFCVNADTGNSCGYAVSPIQFAHASDSANARQIIKACAKESG